MFGAEVQEGTVKYLKRKREQVAQEKNQFTSKVSKLEGYLLEKTPVMKDMNHRVKRFQEQRRKLSAENESLPVTDGGIVSLPRNLLRQKRSVKETNKLSENSEVQYLGICYLCAIVFQFVVHHGYSVSAAVLPPTKTQLVSLDRRRY